jgi:hypothetical protein
MPLPAAALAGDQLSCFANDTIALFSVKLYHTPRGGTDIGSDRQRVPAKSRHCLLLESPGSVRIQVEQHNIGWKDSIV